MSVDLFLHDSMKGEILEGRKNILGALEKDDEILYLWTLIKRVLKIMSIF